MFEREDLPLHSITETTHDDDADCEAE